MEEEEEEDEMENLGENLSNLSATEVSFDFYDNYLQDNYSLKHQSPRTTILQDNYPQDKYLLGLLSPRTSTLQDSYPNLKYPKDSYALGQLSLDIYP